MTQALGVYYHFTCQRYQNIKFQGWFSGSIMSSNSQDPPIHLLHHPQEVGDIASWLQNGCSSSKYYIFTQCMCKVIKEAQCLPLIHIIFLLLLRRNILLEAPKIIPFMYHWPLLDHLVFLHWKEIRIVNIWYIRPLS